jgi:hypothetical protein
MLLDIEARIGELAMKEEGATLMPVCRPQTLGPMDYKNGLTFKETSNLFLRKTRHWANCPLKGELL